MFRWENPEAFKFLILVPVLFVMIWFSWRSREKQLVKAFNSRLLKALTSSRSLRKRKLKIFLELLVVVLCTFALARPQMGQSQQKVKSEGIELIVALDVSNSMMAEDIKPNRLEHAKNEIGRLMAKLAGDKIGLVAFAGSAVLLSPMTNDYSSLQMFLDTAGPTTVTTQGTNFEAAINVATGAIQRAGIDPDEGVQVTKAILIVTDGEATEADALEAAKVAVTKGYRIFTLGLGTRAGAPIPERDEFGYLKGYKKDREGKTILSTSKEDALSSLAQAGGGAYYHSDFSGQAIEKFKADIDRMQKAEFETSMAAQYDEYFQWILLVALLLALIELSLGERKNQAKLWRGRFETMMLIPLLFLLSGCKGSDYLKSYGVNRKAMSHLAEERKSEAFGVLTDRIVEDSQEEYLHYNLGVLFENNEESEKAVASYGYAYKLAEKNKAAEELMFAAAFNAGNAAAKLKNKDLALEFYQKALKHFPDSKETKNNIEILMQDQQQQGGGGGGDQKKDQNQNQDQKKDQKDDKGDDQKKNEPKEQDNKQQEKPKPKPFKSESMSPQVAKEILEDLKRQEEQIRAKFNEKYRKENRVEKDW